MSSEILILFCPRARAAARSSSPPPLYAMVMAMAKAVAMAMAMAIGRFETVILLKSKTSNHHEQDQINQISSDFCSKMCV